MRPWRVLVLGAPLVLGACTDRPFGESTGEAPGSSTGTDMGSSSGVPTTGDAGSTGPGSTATTTMTSEPDGGTFDDEGCIEQQDYILDFIRPDIMLVIDKSGSMDNTLWDHDG